MKFVLRQNLDGLSGLATMPDQAIPTAFGWLTQRDMLRRDMDTNPSPTIQDLFPGLTEKELTEAEDNLERYLALVLRIFERIEANAVPQADPLAPDTDPVS